MFEKFRLKKLSKVVQTVVTHFFEQVTKKDYLATFYKINFLNIENVALLYEKNKHISNSGIDLSFLENVDLKRLVENFERLCANGYINFIENDIRKKIIEKITKLIYILPKLHFCNVILNYTSVSEKKKISRAPPYNF